LSMNALYKDYSAKGLAMVAIATDAEGTSVVAPFMQAYGLIFPVLLDPQNMVRAQLQLSGLPTSYLLDKWGRVIDLVLGAYDWHRRKTKDVIEELLEEEGRSTTP